MSDLYSSMPGYQSKLELHGPRCKVATDTAISIASSILQQIGVGTAIAQEVAEHLVESDLAGVESHGIMRVLQYAEQYSSGHLDPSGEPVFQVTKAGAPEVDGRGGIGIPAMRLAFNEACRIATETGMACLAIRDAGHTGRHGAFANWAAEQGFLTILLGGGKRHQWRQVAPYGGAKALLPTNPLCIGIPGGAHGANVADFATSKIAGGWIYAAQAAGALLPENCVIDKHGQPTRKPQDYFDGGAILPFGGHKGFALALIGELIGEAMLGPVSVECNWLLICIDTRRFRSPASMKVEAETILSEIRNCPPAPGFQRVEIPGEREREHCSIAGNSITVPGKTWLKITDLARSLSQAKPIAPV